jgi:hypothetical protein
MRDYGKVHSKFWSSADIRALTDSGRLLAVYLMTSPHSTIAGVFRLPDGYVCEDMQWTSEQVSEAFGELLSKGFANRCETSKWVWVTKHLEWNPPENPNQRKSAAKVAHGVPDDCTWKLEFMRVCGPSIGIEPPPKVNPSRTVKQPFLNQEQKQEQKQEENILPGFARFWSAWPKSDRKAARGKCLESWVKAKAEGAADAVIAHVERMKASPGWKKQNGEFIPAPLVYLNQRSWEGADEGMAFCWWLAAGFSDRFEAENHGCYEKTARLFRDGKREVAA